MNSPDSNITIKREREKERNKIVIKKEVKKTTENWARHLYKICAIQIILHTYYIFIDIRCVSVGGKMQVLIESFT